VNYTPFAGIHFAENEGSPTLAHPRGSVICHRAKFSLARRPKAFNIANDSLSLRRGAAERLVQHVLKGQEQLATLGLQ
jgi:hypothetical protein